jgi:hypothetical protein
MCIGIVGSKARSICARPAIAEARATGSFPRDLRAGDRLFDNMGGCGGGNNTRNS